MAGLDDGSVANEIQKQCLYSESYAVFLPVSDIVSFFFVVDRRPFLKLNDTPLYVWHHRKRYDNMGYDASKLSDARSASGYPTDAGYMDRGGFEPPASAV